MVTSCSWCLGDFSDFVYSRRFPRGVLVVPPYSACVAVAFGKGLHCKTVLGIFGRKYALAPTRLDGVWVVPGILVHQDGTLRLIRTRPCGGEKVLEWS